MWAKALGYLGQAGAKAFARSALREAGACFEQALGTLPHLPEDRDTLEQAIDLRVELRHVLVPLGELSRVFEYLREAEKLAQALGDQRRLGRVSASMAHHFWAAGEPDRAIAAGQRALEIAQALGDFAPQIEGNWYLGLASHSLGDHRRALECFGRNVASLHGELVRERFGMPYLPSVASRGWLVTCLAELGEFAEAIAPGEEMVRIAEAVDHPFSLVHAYRDIGSLCRRRGEFPKAIPLLERGLGVCQAWHILSMFPWIASALGHAYALAGRVAEALPLLEQAVERGASMRLVASHSIRVAYLGETYLLAGRMDDAIRFAGRALDLSRNHKERANEPWALRLLGEIASHPDPPDVETAEAHSRQAMALAGELGMRPLLAHCHLGLGTLYSKVARREEARAELAAAIELYRFMEMTFWLEKAEAKLARVP